MCKISWRKGSWPSWVGACAMSVLWAFTCPLAAQEAPAWTLQDYVAFVQGRDEPGPPSLGNSTIAETSPGAYSVAFPLENIGSDVTEVHAVLWRLVDQPAYRHFFGEDSRILANLQAQGAVVSFSGLKRGEIYGVHLAVTTNMPTISFGQTMADAQIGVQTTYLFWPWGSDSHLTVQDLFVPYDREKSIAFQLEGGKEQRAWSVRSRHFDGHEEEISKPSKDSHRLFCQSEMDLWQPENIESLVALVEAGTAGSREVITLPLAHGCLGCNPLALLADSEKTIISNPLTVGMRNGWGAAITKIRFTFSSNGVQTGNLISGLNPGMLLQSAGWKVRENWVEQGHNAGLGTYSEETWENDPVHYSNCGDDAGFGWNPTQASSDTAGSTLCTPGDNVLDSNISATCKRDNNTTEVISEIALPGGTTLTPPVRYIAKYVPWHPYDLVHAAAGGGTNPLYWKYQADLWEDCTLSVEQSDVVDVGTLKFRSKFRLSKYDSSGAATIWPSLTTEGGTLPGPNVDYTAQDRLVSGSRLMRHGYVYYPPANLRDRWNMVETGSDNTAPPRCLVGNQDCYKDQGWYGQLYNINPSLSKWAPYLMMSTDTIAGTSPPSKVYVMLYSGQDSMPRLAARTVALGLDDAYQSSDLGDEIWITTLFNNEQGQRTLTTNAWTPDLNTYVIVGGSRAAVMSELGRICRNKPTGFKYPWNTRFIKGTITGLGSQQALVTVSGPEGPVTVKTESGTGNYAVYGLYDWGTPGPPVTGFTVTPSLAGLSFSPANSTVPVIGSDISGINFVATPAGGPCFYLTTQTSPVLANCAVTKNPTQSSGCSGAGYYVGGALVTLTAMEPCGTGPLAPYLFDHWKFGSTDCPTCTENPYAYTMPSQNITVKAVYISDALMISGHVRGPQNQGIAGIRMKASALEGVTDDDGAFTFVLTGLPEGDYTIEPSAEDAAKYRFAPPSRTVHYQGQSVKNADFTVVTN